MSFIKSIVGWFKRKKDEPKCLSDVISNITPVSTPFMEAFNQMPSSFYTVNQPAFKVNTDFTSKENMVSAISSEIDKKRYEILAAKKAKKRSSHLQKQLKVLVARKLELEGK